MLRKQLHTIAKYRSDKAFQASIENRNDKTVSKSKKLCELASSMGNKAKIEIAKNLLERKGWRSLRHDKTATNLNSVEGRVLFEGIPPRGKYFKKVVVFLTNFEPKAIVVQDNPRKGFTWMINGQAGKNAHNIPLDIPL